MNIDAFTDISKWHQSPFGWRRNTENGWLSIRLNGSRWAWRLGTGPIACADTLEQAKHDADYAVHHSLSELSLIHI